MSKQEEGRYGDLDMERKRRMIAAHEQGNIALNFLRKQGNNKLVRMFLTRAKIYAHRLTDEQVNAEIAKLDQLVEESQKQHNRNNKVRSLFR